MPGHLACTRRLRINTGKHIRPLLRLFRAQSAARAKTGPWNRPGRISSFVVAFGWHTSPTRLGKGWIPLKGIFRCISSQCPKLTSGNTPERLHTLLLSIYTFLETARAENLVRCRSTQNTPFECRNATPKSP